MSRRPAGRTIRHALVGAAMLAGASKAEGERVAKSMLCDLLPANPEEFVYAIRSRVNVEQARTRARQVDDDAT